MSTKAHKGKEDNTQVSSPMFTPITPDTFHEIERRIGGRPSKLTPELVSTIEDFILRGNYILTSCLAAGITRQLYYQWMGFAENHINEGKTEEESEFIRFLVTCEKARAAAEIILTDKVMTRDAFWQRWSWMLERTRPQSYSIKQQLEITQDVTLTSVSLPAPPQDFNVWLSNQIATNNALKSLRTTELDISDADVVSDTEDLERVEMRQIEDKSMQEKKIGENSGKDK